jgi:hypothetical protein
MIEVHAPTPGPVSTFEHTPREEIQPFHVIEEAENGQDEEQRRED